MFMGDRVRTQITYRNGGVWGNGLDPTTHYDGDVIESWFQCSDDENHGLFIEKIINRGGRISRKPTNPNRGWCDGYVVPPLRGLGALGGHISVTGYLTNAEVAAKTQASSNPSRPVVDVPIALLELREFPELFRIAGNTLLKKLGSLNLNYRFGWKPMMQDLANLSIFSHHVDNRVRELTALRESGIRRKVLCSNLSETINYNELVNSASYASMQVRMTKMTRLRQWGFMTWTPNDQEWPASGEALRRFATKAVEGLTIDPSTVWNVLPWSWLVDWCTSVGDYFSAYRNIVPATPSPVMVMKHTLTETRFEGKQGEGDFGTNNGPIIDPGGCTYETKSRSPRVSPAIEAHLPFLSVGQMSILGSLSVMRR
jgi:hypothetical protein